MHKYIGSVLVLAVVLGGCSDETGGGSGGTGTGTGTAGAAGATSGGGGATSGGGGAAGASTTGGGAGAPASCDPLSQGQNSCKAYTDCAQAKCDAKYQVCLGANYKSGDFTGGVCSDFMKCVNACPCDDKYTSCQQGCFGKAGSACTSCLTTELSGCIQANCSAELQACGSGSGAGGSSSGAGGTGGGVPGACTGAAQCSAQAPVCCSLQGQSFCTVDAACQAAQGMVLP